ncbi:MAG TPA: P-loop NTPase fold protein [Chitinispirillaceae bacterium]|nr:P-loop NTPase fold protein [Chitinispirillaceae bacterium]
MTIRSGCIKVSEHDLYNSEPVIRRIYSSLSSIESPVSLAAVFGPQGSGRTSILNLCYDYGLRKCDSELSKKTFWIKPFQSWKMSGMGNLVNALLWHIHRSFPDSIQKDEKILYKISKISISLSALIAPLDIPDPDYNLEVIKKTLSPERKSPVSSYFSVFEHIEELSENFSRLGEQICEQCGFEKIVTLIDDIERCVPAQVISFLFYLRNLISCERFSFLVAADRSILSQYLNTVYGGCLTPSQSDCFVLGYFDDWVSTPQPQVENVLGAIDFPIDSESRAKFIEKVKRDGLLRMVPGTVAQYALKRFELFLSEDTVRSSSPLQNYTIWLGWFLAGTKNPELIRRLSRYSNLENCFNQIRGSIKKPQVNKSSVEVRKTILKIRPENKEPQRESKQSKSDLLDIALSDDFFISFLEKAHMITEKELVKRFREVVAYL